MRTLASLALLASLHFTARCQETSWEPIVVHGEELTYAVKWGVFRLGTITIRTYRDSACSEPSEIKVSMKVESNPSLGFISVWEWSESMIDGQTRRSKQFRSIYRDGKVLLRTAIRYDAEARSLHYINRDYNTAKVLDQVTISNANPYVEGPSLFFVTRCYSTSGEAMNIPTFINGKLGSTDLDFRGRTEDVKIEAFDAPIRTRTYQGRTHWNGAGVAGLAGKFSGWISDDPAAVVIQAEMKVFLGAIRLELESWNRPGWVPPTGSRTLVASPAGEAASTISGGD